jgi:hypothetical protein
MLKERRLFKGPHGGKLIVLARPGQNRSNGPLVPWIFWLIAA